MAPVNADCRNRPVRMANAGATFDIAITKPQLRFWLHPGRYQGCIRVNHANSIPDLAMPDRRAAGAGSRAEVMANRSGLNPSMRQANSRPIYT